jgi:hypothetical protein
MSTKIASLPNEAAFAEGFRSIINAQLLNWNMSVKFNSLTGLTLKCIWGPTKRQGQHVRRQSLLYQKAQGHDDNLKLKASKEFLVAHGKPQT